jgi:5-deoxy-glucuronate isomerase
MNLLVHPAVNGGRVETFGFEYLGFQVRQLVSGAQIEEETGDRELGIVVLGGVCAVECAGGAWDPVGARGNVFDGLPYALYLPLGTRFHLEARTACDLAFCYSKARRACPPRLVTPAEVEVEIRGGGNATRRIHHLLKPEFAADRLLIVEVYTPGGNWSSYPPHKHDVHNPPAEVDLEEFYYYRVDRPEGYAIQKVYTPDRRIDETLTVRDGELVLVPEGYHPVVAAHGYEVYYLNVLAGSARSMAAADDPAYAWVRGTWPGQERHAGESACATVGQAVRPATD